jgi:hypothetical protein
MRGKSMPSLNFAACLALAWVLIAAQLLTQYWIATADTLFDSDDAMRLVQLRGLLAGHGWFNLHEARIDPPVGYDSHWSRLIDAGLTGLLLLFRCFADGAMAERLMRATWPLLWILPTLIGTAAIAWRIAGRQAAMIVLVFAIIGMPAFHQFTPGRIDHHNVQIALSILVLAATVWSDRVVWAPIAAGTLSGVALAIGFESLPYLALCAVAMAARYVIARGSLPALRAYGLSIVASVTIAFVVSVGPDRWFSSVCDSIAWNSALPVVIGGLVATLGTTMRAQERSSARLAVVAIAAGATLLAFVVIEPRCLGGPYAMMEPAAKAHWLASVPEMKPFFSLVRESPVLAAWMATFPLLALLSAALLAQDPERRGDFGFVVAVGALAIATALTITMIKSFSYGVWLGMPLVAAWVLRLFAQLRLTNVVTRGVVTILLAPLTLSITASTIANATIAANDTSADVRTCFRIESYAALAQLPPGNVLTNVLDYAPHVLALTRHTVMAAPYHRLSREIADAYQAFASPPEQARRILVRAHVDYIATCGSRGPVGLKEDALRGGLWDGLRSGSVPAWLKRVSEPGQQPFVIYRLMP